MDGIKRFRGTLDKALEAVIIFLSGLMVVVGAYQILVRYLFLLAAAYMFGKNGHMRMGFLADKAEGSSKRTLEMISQCLIFGFAAVIMIYGGIQITSLTMSQRTASLGIPMGYVYLIVPLSGVLILVYSIMNMAEMTGRAGKEESR